MPGYRGMIMERIAAFPHVVKIKRYKDKHKAGLLPKRRDILQNCPFVGETWTSYRNADGDFTLAVGFKTKDHLDEFVRSLPEGVL